MSEGFIACHAPGCSNQEAAVTQTKTGTFYISCHRCKLSSYAKAGSKAHASIKALIDPAPAPAAAPAAPTSSMPTQTKPESVKPAPVPAKKKQVFDLSQLV